MIKTDVEVKDGALSVDFIRVEQNPAIKAIEVHPAASSVHGSPQSTPNPTSLLEQEQEAIFINCGGNSFVDPAGNTWIKDRGLYSEGTRRYSTLATINNTENKKLFLTERYKPTDDASSLMKYDIDVQNGVYDVSLYFAEIFSGAFNSGARVFNVSMEGNLIADEFDVFNAAGEAGNTAYILYTTAVAVSDRALTIDFIGVQGNPKIHQPEATQEPRVTSDHNKDGGGDGGGYSSGIYNRARGHLHQLRKYKELH